jgi:hypothetical protein
MNYCFLPIVFVAASLVLFTPSRASAAEESETNSSPRQVYNNGTRKLQEKKFLEAEAQLESAVASQNTQVREPALYNLGEARFRDGAEILKKGPERQSVDVTSQHASTDTTSAIHAADAALAGDDVRELVAAYMQGRGARKELKSATEAVQKAMETYANVLTKWQRSSGDFKSALELQPSDLQAKTNAQIVDQNIAKLVDQQQMMMMQMQGMKGQKEELKKKLEQLKGRIPADQGPKLAVPGDDGDDDDGKQPQPKPGDQEPGPKDGKEMLLTREEAARLLGMLKLDTNRKLAVSEGDTGKLPERKGRDW